MCESAGLKSFSRGFSPAPCLPCKVCTKARSGVSLSGARVFLCMWYFGSRQCCCFPVVRWLDSREDYITLEMCPLIHYCLPHSFPFFYSASFICFIFHCWAKWNCSVSFSWHVSFLMSKLNLSVNLGITLLLRKIASFLFPRKCFNNSLWFLGKSLLHHCPQQFIHALITVSFSSRKKTLFINAVPETVPMQHVLSLQQHMTSQNMFTCPRT